VPISIRHKKLNLEVLRETVFDGELLLKGTDLFYVHEVYTVHVAATIRTEEAVAELTVGVLTPAPRGTVRGDRTRVRAADADRHGVTQTCDDCRSRVLPGVRETVSETTQRSIAPTADSAAAEKRA
jgi:hypothetical protein